MIERTTVRLPKDLLDKARRKAARERRSVTGLIEEGLRFIVEGKPTARGAKRKLPRTSKATGGMRRGLEGMTYSQLQELDDIEYVERLKRGFE